MISPESDLDRRRPVWDALSQLFLDTEHDAESRREIARLIVDSRYSPGEILSILWDELFPILSWNLLSPHGEWNGINLDDLELRILSRRYRRTWLSRVTGLLPLSPTRSIRQEWEELLPFLPDTFRSPAS